MKILQINAIYKYGSTGRTCYEFQEYINKKTGYECKTAFCTGGDGNDGFIIGSVADRKIHAFMSRLSGKQGYYSFNATKRLLKFIEEYKPDIIHLRNLHGNYINLPMLFGFIKKNNIPLVVTLHDCWFYTGKCMHYTTIGCNKWQKECGNCPNLKEGNKSWVFDRTEKLLQNKKEFFSETQKVTFVGVSDWITNEIRKSSIGQSAFETMRIYNWIDTDLFRSCDSSDIRKKYGLENKFVVLGVSGSWDNKKGLDDFIKLNSKLYENQKIVLVGNLKNNDSLPENIINIKSTDSVKELAEIYNMADVFVTFSKEESFGKVSAEALSCGVPVICYDSTANPELIGENCGYVVKPDNIDETFDKICLVEKNGKDKYTDACVEFAKQNFNKEKCINSYLNLYENLVE